MDTERLIRRTFALARQAANMGNEPFGALLASAGGTILCEAENQVNEDGGDPTRHSEMILVSQACRTLDPSILAQATLFTSTEPCPMCAGAIYWAGIRKIVYSTPTEQLAALAGPALVVPCRVLYGGAAEPVEVVGPLLLEEGLEIHRRFW